MKLKLLGKSTTVDGSSEDGHGKESNIPGNVER